MKDQLRINKEFSNDTLNFNLNNYKLRMSLFENSFISGLPRLIIDYLIFLSIPMLIYISSNLLSFDINISVYLSSLIALGVAMQRLLPTINLLLDYGQELKLLIQVYLSY